MRIQPAWCASAAEVEQEFERSDELVCLAQQCPQLASAGMLTLGYGQPQALDAAAAAATAAQAKRPFGLWRVTLPPANDLALPAMLPPPHPQMRADEPAQAWLTTEDLDGLAKDVRDGGAGLTIEQLAVDEAIVWPQQSRILEAWATRLREARETFRDDSAAAGFGRVRRRRLPHCAGRTRTPGARKPGATISSRPGPRRSPPTSGSAGVGQRCGSPANIGHGRCTSTMRT